MDVKSGDKILFGKWSGTEVKIDGEDLLIMKESRHSGRRTMLPDCRLDHHPTDFHSRIQKT